MPWLQSALPEKNSRYSNLLAIPEARLNLFRQASNHTNIQFSITNQLQVQRYCPVKYDSFPLTRATGLLCKPYGISIQPLNPMGAEFVRVPQPLWGSLAQPLFATFRVFDCPLADSARLCQKRCHSRSLLSTRHRTLHHFNRRT